jgi:hypothetical protein
MIRHSKRKKIHRTQHNIRETKIETHNQYGLLTNETSEDSTDGNPRSMKIHKPPPIFVHGVISYGEMNKRQPKMNSIAQKIWQTMLLK